MKKKILIVEDEEMLAKVLIDQFSKAGFDVEGSPDGESALKSLEKSKPDIVLLDIILPKINGFDVLKAIKENPDTQDIPVIMISNLGRDEDIKQSIKLGAADYYIKAQHPIFEIIEKVSKFLSLPKSPLESPKVSIKERKVAAPVIAVKEKPAEIEQALKKPIEKVAEKLKVIEKIIEESPKETIIRKPAEKAVEKPAEKIAEKITKEVAEKPKKEAIEKPSEEIGKILGKIVNIVEDSAKKVIKKQVEKTAQGLKVAVAEKQEFKETETSPVATKQPIDKKIKKEKMFPQLSKSARKFIRMKKAELNKINLTPEERQEKVAKLYEVFSPKKNQNSQFNK